MATDGNQVKVFVVMCIPPYDAGYLVGVSFTRDGAEKLKREAGAVKRVDSEWIEIEEMEVTP